MLSHGFRSGVILDYMIMHWEEVPEMRAAVRRDHELGDRLHHEVGSAMELLRYEKNRPLGEQPLGVVGGPQLRPLGAPNRRREKR